MLQSRAATVMPSAALRPGSPLTFRGKVHVAAVLLLAWACSRAPESHTALGKKPDAPPPATAALALGEAARERGEFPLAKAELERARGLFEHDGNWEGYVRVRNLLGAMASSQGDYKSALEHLNAALGVAQAKLAPGHLEFARSYYEIATVYVSTGRLAEGLELLGKALALRRSAGAARTTEVSEILLRMGVAYSEQGEDDRALALFDEAEAIERDLPAHVRLGDVLIGKGNALWGQGRYDQAIETFEQAVRILEGQGSRRAASLAAAYVNLGNAYWSKSDYDEALAYYEKALPLQVAARGEAHQYVGLIHFNRATLFLMKRDYAACIASAEKALKILLAALGERNVLVVQTYNALGLAYTRNGDPDRGIDLLEKARDLQLSLPEKGGRDAAVIYSSLAEAHRAKGNLTESARVFREALAIDISIHGQRHPDVAEDFVNLGDLYLARGDEATAIGFYSKAIAANTPQPVQADPDLDPPIETVLSDEFLLKALDGAARARARRGMQTRNPRDLQAAATVYAQAARLIDRMRAGYRAEGSKLTLAETATETYDQAIGTELELYRLTGEQHHLENAFRCAEQSKAGVLRDALNEAEARSFARIPAALVEEERRVRSDLATADRQLTETELEVPAEQRQLQVLREKQFTLKRRYEALQQRLEKEFSDYYDLKYRFDTVRPSEIRERALNEQTVLIEYFVGREWLYIFTITVQDLQVTSVALDGSLDLLLREFRRTMSPQDIGSFAQSAHRLYQALLGPVESRSKGKDLIIVPDGLLNVVPFEALLEREVSPRSDSSGPLPYVLRDHTVSYAYSATVLVQGLQRNMERPLDEFVGFAPGFAERAGRDQAPRPLPASQREVTDVREIFKERAGFFGGWFSGRSRVYLGHDATVSRLKSAGLERYRYVHLATHGVVDENHPALSRLLFESENGSAAHGVLTLGEIYNLRLNADLVVLSACDTGRGEIARGEGIIGLTRGFLYAGAKSLLVSLWPVSDEATADLMVDFYAELLRGRSKAQALREAKLRSMRRNPEYAKPFYWSSLVLVGDWR
jgi:CHAT domain-containing protein/Tfp pilus assembly protein PilF